MDSQFHNRLFSWSFWEALKGVVGAEKIKPFREGKHAGGKAKPKNWEAKKKRLKKMAERSRRINRALR